MEGDRRRSTAAHCGHPEHAKSCRREFLYIGLIGGLGLTLPDFLRRRALADQEH